MLDFNFLKIAEQQMKTYANFPLPVIVCDTGLEVYWANRAARNGFAGLTKQDGMKDALAGFEWEKLMEDIMEKGCVTISGVPPFFGVNINLSPIFVKSDIVGITVIIIDAAAAPLPLSETGKAVEMFSQSLRGSINGIFRASDSAYLKSVMMDGTQWLSPHLNLISAQAYRILRMGNNLADYTRYQNGALMHNFSVVDIFAWLRGISDAVADIAQNAGTPVSFNIDNGAAFVRMDISAFEAAFYNIIYNSLSFTRDNNSITVSALKSGGVEIEICDSGIGMDDNTLANAFRPFYAGVNAKGGMGIGLGLTVASLSMTALGGGLIIESKPEKGTKATLSLPSIPFTHPLPLEQGGAGKSARYAVEDRFSALYVGLMGIYAENEA